jgi:hypothetical protein
MEQREKIPDNVIWREYNFRERIDSLPTKEEETCAAAHS